MGTTTKFWTWAQIKRKVEQDLSLESEVMIDDEEMLGYANEAIDFCESMVHTLYEDYFLTKSTIPLVSGVDEYNLPPDIYAHKIRRLTYRNGSKVYTLSRVKDWKKFEVYEVERVASATTEYVYFLLNSTPGSPKIVLSPPSMETGAFLTAWYYRQSNRLEEDSDVCDIPEGAGYVIQYMKMRCYEKEGHPNVLKSIDDLRMKEQQLLGVLQTMIPDADNEIEADMSHYEEMV